METNKSIKTLSTEHKNKIARSMHGNYNSGSQHAAKLVSDCLRKLVIQDPSKLRKACEAILVKAGDGDVPAFNAIADRLDGKIMQASDGSTTIINIDALLVSRLSDLMTLKPSVNTNVTRVNHDITLSPLDVNVDNITPLDVQVDVNPSVTPIQASDGVAGVRGGGEVESEGWG